MSHRNFIIYDTETTGLNPEEGHEITQLSAITLNGHNFQPHHVGPFNIFIKPQHPEKASKKALEVARASFDKAMASGVPIKTALAHFNDYCAKVNPSGKMMEKPIMVGHNEKFDRKFINHYALETKLFKNLDDANWGHQVLDTKDIMVILYESDLDVKQYNLDTALSLLGLARTGTSHDAMEDVELTAQLFVRYMQFFRRCRKKMNILSPEKADQLNAPKA